MTDVRRGPATACCRVLLPMMMLVVGMSGAASGQSWGVAGIQLLHGEGFELGPPERDILTFEHASGWRLGSNFFFFDVTEPFGDETDIYGEWYSRLSWTQLGLTDAHDGWLGDVSFAGGLNLGNGFRAYLAGATIHFKVPGFSFLDLDLMAYDDRSDSDVTYIVTPAWDLPFRLGSVSCRFRGFADLIGAEGARVQQLLTQPQLLVDLGAAWGHPESLFVGVEYQYWRNKYGIDGVGESLPQVMLLWQL